MKRGDIVLVTAPGDFGKRRPAVIVQSDFFNATHATVLVCLITGTLIDAPLYRLTVDPTPGNGLAKPSQIMVDKVIALNRNRVSDTVGILDADALLRLDRSLAVFLGLA